MLEIAYIIFAVVAVLFGTCLTIFIKSYRSYQDEDADIPEDKTDKPRKRIKPETEAPSVPEDKTDKPRKRIRPETEAPAPVTSSPSEPKPEIKPEKPEEPEDKPEEIDISATRVSTADEMAKLRAAAPKPAEKAPEPPKPEKQPVPAAPVDEDDDGKQKLLPVILIAIAIIALVAVIAVIFTFNSTPKETAEEPPETITATVQDIQLQQTFNGRITSPDILTSMFAATGEITDLSVKEGDFVTSGTVIYTIDSSNIQARIDLLNERLASLADSRTASGRTTVASPVSGTVTAVRAADGEKVSAKDVIAEITIPADHRVSVALTTHVSIGDKVSVSTNGTTVQGTVTAVNRVNNAPDDDEDEDDDEEKDTPTYNATVTFTTSAAVGSTATVTVSGEKFTGSVTKGRISTVSVTAGVSGTLTSIRIDEGDSISEGDTIATVEVQRQTSAGESFDERELRLEIEQLNSQLENYTVKASADGYVQKLYLKKGDNAAVGMSAVAIVPSTGLVLAIEMNAEIAEALVVPRQALFRIRRAGNFPSEVWSSIDTDADYTSVLDTLTPNDDGSKYVGYVTLEDPTLFRDGMTAQVTINTYAAYNAVTVPKELVKDGKVNILTDSGQIVAVPVETGITTEDGYTEITGGLTISDRIVAE